MEIAGDAIGPVTSQYIAQSIEKAEELRAECLVIQLDTPGGLLESTHHIVKKILNSEIPIVVYVSPKGARAASAGTFITLAANIAAMAPSTAIGAASPVDMMQRSPSTEDKDDSEMRAIREILKKYDDSKRGDSESGEPSDKAPEQDAEKGKNDTDEDSKQKVEEEENREKETGTKQKDVMMKKVENYAVAWIQSIAKDRKRNHEWAAKAVRDASTLTATEALEQNVIDLIAKDLDDLLQQIDGMELTVNDEQITLHTSTAQRKLLKMSISQRILSVISNPNIVYFLFIIGMLGITFEVTHPGAIFPGVIGAICLILAFFSLQVLPVNYAGVALLILAMVLLLLEIKIASYGLLALGGLIAMILGSLMLFDTDLPYMQVSKSLVIAVSIFLMGVFYLVLRAVWNTHRRKPFTGSQGILEEKGVAITEVGETGTVRIHGELWSAFSDRLIPAHSKVRVINVEGLILKVEILV